MQNIKLFGNRFSGHTYKVALFLALTKTPYTYEQISLTLPRAQRPQHFARHSRYGEVPLLMIDGKPFVQSNAILIKLSQMLGPMSGDAPSDRVHEWLMWEQSRLGSSLPNLRFEKKFKSGADPAVLAWLCERLKDDLNVLDTHFASAGRFVVADAPTIADCSLAGYLFWLADVDLDIADWPRVKSWLDRISQLDGWKHPDDLI